ncbi:glycosyltransferase family 4 protein [Halorhodospira halochloris]|nr:glycosyltransferase family 4 protein [Halorhodospira halochloris]
MRDFVQRSSLSPFVVIGTEPGPGFAGVVYRNAPLRPSWWLSRNQRHLAAVKNALALMSPALITVHNRPKLASTLKRKMNVPVMLYLHNDISLKKGFKRTAQRRQLVDSVDAIVCVSQYLKVRLLEGTGHAGENVHVIHNGVEVKDFDGGVKDKENVILFVGRIDYEKGVIGLLEAAEEVLPEHPSWRLAVVGPTRYTDRGLENEALRALKAADEKLGNQLVYHEFLPHEQVIEWFRKAAIAVTPAIWSEPFGRTSLEAMASRCALISSSRGGLEELVGDCAAQVNPEDSAEIAGALRWLMRDACARERIGDHCFRRSRLFDVGLQADMLDRVRAELISAKS